MNTLWSIALTVTGGLLLRLLILAAPALARPRGDLLTEAIRLLPDLLRPLPRLARDRALPQGAVRLWLLLGYLAMPLDLVPGFIPVLGYADDALVVVRGRPREPRQRNQEATLWTSRMRTTPQGDPASVTT
ncbi:hypothetical protein Shyhy01_21920 [Streptomyces hygroscopicus subsp. hygroscopicus]|nr:YkvA family protein [Streptomyces hygroscopicus]GLX49242.1 hypothetical protein Shyhy01_21920 [Streptomyces hygroscopicus subsp. hygroscopicus]